jgi:alpha-galactosidase
MPKITFMGAGSSVFAKNILGDSMLSPALHDAEIALYDIDAWRLRESKKMLENLNRNINKKRAKIRSYLGKPNRKAALKDADYVVNAIQVGGYEPSTVIDFEIPKKYGLRQTIADTIGIGGVFRTLRTAPVMMSFAQDMEKVCPDAWFLNYTNPMCAVTGAILRGTSIRAVGLCHSVQACASRLLRHVGMLDDVKDLQWKIAGINHQAWLLEITDGGKDLYSEIKRRAAKMNREARKKGAEKHPDMVRFEMMRHFGYYVTESSEHSAEYMPYWIKTRYPELIEEFNIPLDEYPRRCIRNIEKWKTISKEMIQNSKLKHKRTSEYGSYIMEAMETDVPFRIGGNILNDGNHITNLPSNAVVEVACLVDRNGIQGSTIGDLPEQLAALNRTKINTQLCTLEAVFNRSRDSVYQAAMLDPHTSAELSLDDIRKMCDEMIKAHEMESFFKKGKAFRMPKMWNA